MEGGWSWEQKTLISELMQGMELAKQLKVHLNVASVETKDLLLQRILSSYEKALFILNWSGSLSQQAQTSGVPASIPESPKSTNESPRSDDLEGSIRDGSHSLAEASKKRKATPRWTDQVRISPENGLEGPRDDGYSWRKYGQKDILGARYPRSYYRCTYRNTQNCWATKQVQRSDEDPTVFEVTYRGLHTCSHGQQSGPTPASPEKQEQKQNSSNSNNQPQQQQPSDATLNLQKGLRVNTGDLENKEMVSPFSFPPTYGCIKSVGSYSPPFISPVTSEPCYNPVPPFQLNNLEGVQNFRYSESDFTEIISTNTSASNSPIVDLEFPLESQGLDANFPFDTPDFFSH